jgi:hypothetical protein
MRAPAKNAAFFGVDALREARADGQVRAAPGIPGFTRPSQVTGDVIHTVEFGLFPEGQRPARSSSPALSQERA